MKKSRKLNTYADFMSQDMWLIFIDGHRLDEGPMAFESKIQYSFEAAEPGYVKGMSTAVEYMNSHITEPITPQFIERVHDLCIDPIDHLRNEVKGYRDTATRFRLLINTTAGDEDRAILSPQGLVELARDLTYIRENRLRPNGYPVNQIVYETPGELGEAFVVYETDDKRKKGMESYSGTPEFVTHITTSELQTKITNNQNPEAGFNLTAGGNNKAKIRAYVQEDINKLYAELKVAKQSGNEDDVIKAIVKFTRGCLQSHYFKDANGRTFVPLMLNHLLKLNGLSPAIIMTPNHFSGFSLNELVDEVKSGMRLYQESTVTISKKTIESLTVKDFLNSPEKCQKLIDKSLSPHPLIQLAQLNELYIRVANGKITCGGLEAWTQKSNTTAALKSMLQNLYAEKVSNIKASLNSNEGENKPLVKTSEILDQITQKHTIHAEKNLAKVSKPDDARNIAMKM